MGNARKARYLGKHKEANKDKNKSSYELYPKFSFEFNVGIANRSIEAEQQDVKLSILKKISYLSKLTWKEIGNLPRQQGFEKIDKASFKTIAGIPQKFIDEKQIDVFRLPSDKGRLIGFIEAETFYVVWIDSKFDMYDH